MAINFPSSPTDGQIYYDPTSGNRYVYDAAATKWKYAANNDPYTGATNTQILFNNQNAIDGNPGLIFDVGANTVYVDRINVSTNVTASYFTGNGAYLTGVASDLSPAFNTANGAYTVANAAFNAANNAVTDFSPAFNVANGAYTIANAAFNSANNVASQVASSFNTANASYTIANASYTVANAAFGKANAALANTNGTFSGNLVFTGNVSVGTTSSINKLTVNGAITLVNAPFFESSANITADYTINTGMNALTPGPVAIANGVFVTIPDGSYWSVT